MRDFQNIQALLEKFWEGETTLEEERQLKGYFASGTVDEQFRQYAPLFQAYREEQTVQLLKPKVVAIRPQQYKWQGWAMAASIALLLAAGAWWIFSTPATAPILADKPQEKPELKTFETPTKPEKHLLAKAEQPKRSLPIRKNIAKSEKPARINSEEEAAMEEIKAALALVSSKIRKGRQEAARGAEHLETIDKIFKKKEG